MNTDYKKMTPPFPLDDNVVLVPKEDTFDKSKVESIVYMECPKTLILEDFPNLKTIVVPEGYVEKCVLKNLKSFRMDCINNLTFTSLKIERAGISSVAPELKLQQNLKYTTLDIIDCKWLIEIPSGHYSRLYIDQCENLKTLNYPILCKNMSLENLENVSFNDGKSVWSTIHKPDVTTMEIIGLSEHNSEFNGLVCYEHLNFENCHFYKIPVGWVAKNVRFDKCNFESKITKRDTKFDFVFESVSFNYTNENKAFEMSVKTKLEIISKSIKEKRKN